MDGTKEIAIPHRVIARDNNSAQGNIITDGNMEVDISGKLRESELA